MTTVEVAWWKEEKIEVILIVLESLWRWRNIYLVIGCWIKVGNVSITEIERQNYSIWLTLCSISGYISHISSDKWNTILRLLLLSMISQHLKMVEKYMSRLYFPPSGHQIWSRGLDTANFICWIFFAPASGTKIKINLYGFWFRGTQDLFSRDLNRNWVSRDAPSQHLLRHQKNNK